MYAYPNAILGHGNVYNLGKGELLSKSVRSIDFNPFNDKNKMKGRPSQEKISKSKIMKVISTTETEKCSGQKKNVENIFNVNLISRNISFLITFRIK